MDRAAIRCLLDAARQLSNHRDYVIIGSLSVPGCDLAPPENMLLSVAVDYIR